MAGEYMKDKILREDLLELIHGECPIEELTNSTVMVTGATGLIGSQIVKSLLLANEELNIGVYIYALCRSKDKFEKIFLDYTNAEELQPIYGDILEPIVIGKDIDYIIHAASATNSKYFVEYPVETIMTALFGTRNVLELAREKHIKGMVYLSSLEVYGVPNTSDGAVTEEQYGYIDPMSIRSSYSEGKRMAECLCASYVKEYDVPVKVARLSQTFGPGVEYNDGRVFAEFARCAIERKNIVLHTAGKTLRTYCYTKDAISALFFILLKGNKGEAYNVANEKTATTIYEMAQSVCGFFPESNIDVEFDVPEEVAVYGYNPEMVIKLDTSKLKRLGWKATRDLKEMFVRMVKSMQA